MTSRGSPHLQKPSALAPIISSSVAPSPPPEIHAPRPSLSRKKSQRLRGSASASLPLDNFPPSSHFVRLAFPSGRELYMNFAKTCAAGMLLIAAIAFAPLSRAQDAKPAETPKAAEVPKPATIEVTPNGTEVHVGDKVQ